MPNKVTLTGLAGEGKSSVGKLLANITGYKRYSAGDYVREIATVRGFECLEAFEKSLDNDPTVDYEVDGRTTNLGKSEARFIFDGRLAWNCIPDAFKVLLTCEDETRFGRIAFREEKPFDQVREETLLRERRMKDRFSRFYSGLGEFDNPKNFHLVIDTTYFSVEQVVARIVPWLE